MTGCDAATTAARCHGSGRLDTIEPARLVLPGAVDRQGLTDRAGVAAALAREHTVRGGVGRVLGVAEVEQETAALGRRDDSFGGVGDDEPRTRERAVHQSAATDGKVLRD